MTQLPLKKGTIKATVLADVRLSRHSSQHTITLFSRGSHWEFVELADTCSPRPCNIHNLCQPPPREITAAVCSKLCLIIALWEVGRVSPVQPRYLSNIQVTMTTAQSKTTPLNCGCLHRSNLWTQESKWSDAVVSPMKYESICHFYKDGRYLQYMHLLRFTINSLIHVSQYSDVVFSGVIFGESQGWKSSGRWFENWIIAVEEKKLYSSVFHSLLLVGVKARPVSYWLVNLKENTLDAKHTHFSPSVGGKRMHGTN